VLLLRTWLQPMDHCALRLSELIEGNLEHATRELLWGSPGTMLAALFLHRATGEASWAEQFTRTARKLWSQLLWSDEEQCHYWMQNLYGHRSTYLDAVHGFVATAAVVIAGRDLLTPAEWQAWSDCIVNTVLRTAEWEGPLVNWRAHLASPRGGPKCACRSSAYVSTCSFTRT
jgi:hypothetical protein